MALERDVPMIDSGIDYSNQTPREMGGGFNWDQYTGGVTGQPSQQIDGTPQVYTGGYDPNSPLYQGNGQPGGGGVGGYGGVASQTPQMWDQNSFQQQFGSPGTPQELEALESRLNAQGIKVSRNASGVAGKIILPNGQYVDVINSAGAGGKGFQWLTGDGGAAGGGGAAANGSMPGFGSYIAPWTQNFNAPTAQQALDSPGLQFAMDEAQKGLESSAAAKGTLLTGGTLKDLTAQRIGMGLQGYGDVYNRAVGEYGINRENFYNNQDRPFGKLSSLASLGANAANQTGGYGSSYGNNATGSLGDIGNANSAGSIAQGNIWGNFINNATNRG